MSENASSKLQWFLMTTAILLVVTLSGAWAVDVRADVQENREAVGRTSNHVTEIEKQFIRIESKLDRLLELHGEKPSRQ